MGPPGTTRYYTEKCYFIQLNNEVSTLFMLSTKTLIAFFQGPFMERLPVPSLQMEQWGICVHRLKGLLLGRWSGSKRGSGVNF